jgi:hypothetical protein
VAPNVDSHRSENASGSRTTSLSAHPISSAFLMLFGVRKCSQEKPGHFHSAREVQVEHRMFHPTFTSPSRSSTTTHPTHCAWFVPGMRGLVYKTAMEEAAAGAAWPGDEAPLSILQRTFPPLDVKSVRLSVNLPISARHTDWKRLCRLDPLPSWIGALFFDHKDIFKNCS